MTRIFLNSEPGIYLKNVNPEVISNKWTRNLRNSKPGSYLKKMNPYRFCNPLQAGLEYRTTAARVCDQLWTCSMDCRTTSRLHNPLWAGSWYFTELNSFCNPLQAGLKYRTTAARFCDQLWTCSMDCTLLSTAASFELCGVLRLKNQKAVCISLTRLTRLHTTV